MLTRRSGSQGGDQQSPPWQFMRLAGSLRYMTFGDALEDLTVVADAVEVEAVDAGGVHEPVETLDVVVVPTREALHLERGVGLPEPRERLAPAGDVTAKEMLAKPGVAAARDAEDRVADLRGAGVPGRDDLIAEAPKGPDLRGVIAHLADVVVDVDALAGRGLLAVGEMESAARPLGNAGDEAGRARGGVKRVRDAAAIPGVEGVEEQGVVIDGGRRRSGAGVGLVGDLDRVDD